MVWGKWGKNNLLLRFLCLGFFCERTAERIVKKVPQENDALTFGPILGHVFYSNIYHCSHIVYYCYVMVHHFTIFYYLPFDETANQIRMVCSYWVAFFVFYSQLKQQPLFILEIYSNIEIEIL